MQYLRAINENLTKSVEAKAYLNNRHMFSNTQQLQVVKINVLVAPETTIKMFQSIVTAGRQQHLALNQSDFSVTEFAHLLSSRSRILKDLENANSKKQAKLTAKLIFRRAIKKNCFVI